MRHAKQFGTEIQVNTSIPIERHDFNAKYLEFVEKTIDYNDAELEKA